mmetsp:Transcript_5366/g.6982  ORF Transcript_5366/g.6982 Transcript_5366/m.6982 type:complete len:398 (+) Transcript_5366:70-1263(+)
MYISQSMKYTILTIFLTHFGKLSSALPTLAKTPQNSPIVSKFSRSCNLRSRHLYNSIDVQAPKNPVVTRSPLSTTLEMNLGGEIIETPNDLMRSIKIGVYFALWYSLNIGYNIFNKKALNSLPLPWTLATFQLFAGVPYVLTLWATGARVAPKLSSENIKNLAPSALCHLGTHIGAVLSLGAGAVSFTHIVKASEPVVSAVLSALFLKQVLPLPVYLSLLPVIGGVGLASLKELSFSWMAFGTAMLSNVASASRAILSKTVMSGKPLGENLTPLNLYAVLTMISFTLLLPMSLFVETPAQISKAWSNAVASGTSPQELVQMVSLSGLFYYLYNEVAFLALSEVAPITHAVGNTIKRVVIIIASVLVFQNPLSSLGALGSFIAIAGTLLYSIAKNKYM